MYSHLSLRTASHALKFYLFWSMQSKCMFDRNEETLCGTQAKLDGVIMHQLMHKKQQTCTSEMPTLLLAYDACIRTTQDNASRIILCTEEWNDQILGCRKIIQYGQITTASLKQMYQCTQHYRKILVFSQPCEGFTNCPRHAHHQILSLSCSHG